MVSAGADICIALRQWRRETTDAGPALAKVFSWTGQVSKSFLRFIGVVDLAGGVGIILPTLTHIHPQLPDVAALSCMLLQVLAIGFHAQSKEITDTSFNFFVLFLSAFVLWGRW